jgi:membrane protease YdiL (CAAX protease family)
LKSRFSGVGSDGRDCRCVIEHMNRFQLSLSSLLLLCAAVPIWLFLIVAVPRSSGWGGSSARFFMAPIVLTGITVAVHRLVRGHRNAWALSALVAAVISLGSLTLAAWMSD